MATVSEQVAHSEIVGGSSTTLHTHPHALDEHSDMVATALVIENRTSDPSSPATGQIWLRTDL